MFTSLSKDAVRKFFIFLALTTCIAKLSKVGNAMADCIALPALIMSSNEGVGCLGAMLASRGHAMELGEATEWGAIRV